MRAMYVITMYFAILAEMSIFLPVQLELRSSSESIQPVMKSFVSELGLTLRGFKNKICKVKSQNLCLRIPNNNCSRIYGSFDPCESEFLEAFYYNDNNNENLLLANYKIIIILKYSYSKKIKIDTGLYSSKVAVTTRINISGTYVILLQQKSNQV